MTVWGADAVEQAAKDGGPLRVGPRDIVTPLARERARELGVEITTGTASSAEPSAATPARSAKSADRSPSRALLVPVVVEPLPEVAYDPLPE